MKSRFLWAVIVCLLLGDGTHQAVTAQTVEGPTYEGRSLRAWLQASAGTEGLCPEEAWAVLNKFCSEVKGAVPALIRTLTDNDEAIRRQAVLVLGVCAADSTAAVAALSRTLKGDKSMFVRGHAAAALAAVGLENEAVVPALLGAMREDPEGQVRAKAAFAFRRRKLPAQVILALTESLKDKDPHVVVQAAHALAAGGDPRVVIPALLAAGGGDEEETQGVAIALSGIGSAAIPPLREALASPRTMSRATAALALGRMHLDDQAPRAQLKELVLPVARLLKDKDPRVRRSAAQGLQIMGEDAATVIPALTEAVGDRDSDVRSKAAIALGQCGPAASAATPALVKVLQDIRESVGIRISAAGSVGRIRPKAQVAVPALLDALNDKHIALRWAVVRALGEIGPEASVAVPVLRELAKDPDETVRRDAAEALRKITR